MFQKLIAPLLIVGVAASMSAQQAASSPSSSLPETIDSAMNARIRNEGMEHSKIMWIEHFLADVYGPRPIGSPNHVAAANWAVKTMTSWGMKNAHLEPFTWRGVGWLPGRASGFMTAPVKANLKFESNPWSPSTRGTVHGDVVSLVAPAEPTEAELDGYLTGMASKVKNGIVMVGVPPTVPVNFCEAEKRIPDSVVKAMYAPRDSSVTPAGRGGGRGGGAAAGCGRGGGFGRGRGAQPAVAEGHLSAQAVNARITQFLRDNMPALRLMYQGGGRIPGEIVAQNGAGQIYDDTTPQPPTVILRNDDAGRIYRIMQDGTPVSIELNMQNQFFPEGKTSYVTVGEIPGTDLADEVVMLGGHLDSWTSATGATDNAIGCAIMMEAVRILEATGAKPRRTIRVALWSGEEEGLLGSFAYVANHFGSAEQPKPEFTKLDAYWNIDDGTGLVRGATIFGPPSAGQILAQYLKPWEGWGVFGATASTARVEGGSDNGAFAVAGLPGIGARQDPIEYNSTTWHSNLDTYERIVPDDVMKNAVMTASVMLGLADRDQMLPRFAPNEMPAIPPARTRFGAPASAAVAHIYSAPKNVPFAVRAPGVLAGGARVAANAMPETAALGSKPTHGRIVLRRDGSFVYTPNKAFTGTDTFTYKVTGAATPGAEAKVTIAVY